MRVFRLEDFYGLHSKPTAPMRKALGGRAGNKSHASQKKKKRRSVPGIRMKRSPRACNGDATALPACRPGPAEALHAGASSREIYDSRDLSWLTVDALLHAGQSGAHPNRRR